jgi:hypothetical protein
MANGLSDDHVYTLAEDRDANLWLGSETGGAMKIARNGIRTYTEADGLRGTRIYSLFEDRAGELFAITGYKNEGVAGKKFLDRFDGKSFKAIPLRPNGISDLGWGSKQIGFEDHAGEWWVATAHGLCRFPHVAPFEQLQYTRPKAIYTTRDGLGGNLIFRVFEDSRGDIWISATDGRRGVGLSCWQRSTGSLRHFPREPEFGDETLPTDFREDRNGALWISFYSGRVARYRDNHFLFLGPTTPVCYASTTRQRTTLARSPIRPPKVFPATRLPASLRICSDGFTSEPDAGLTVSILTAASSISPPLTASRLVRRKWLFATGKALFGSAVCRAFRAGFPSRRSETPRLRS